jgi:very-short-patch-repair endonuclease
MTYAERILWAALRQWKHTGLHFRRQVPFDSYVLDFVCHSAKLVVEVDGSQHATLEGIEHDKKRTAFLESRGYFVHRVWNIEVIKNREGVCDGILELVKTPPDRRAALSEMFRGLRNSIPPPPCGEVGEPTNLRGAHHNERAGWGAPTRNRCAISTSPQGGGGNEDVS